MTIAMPDSVIPGDLLPGYPAYLGYTDGFWPTAPQVAERFPGARLVTLTVRGGDAVGCDAEAGDLTAAQACSWAKEKLQAGQYRPVIYASAATMVSGVLPGLASEGIARASVRLLSAHYGQGEHICGPGSCKYELDGQPIPDMDGTQWTDTFPGAGGAQIDMSALLGDFFGTTGATTVEVDVQLDEVKAGDAGQAVRNWQGLLVAHGYGYLIAPASADTVEARSGIDGQFGAKTASATEEFQKALKIAASGVVDAATWAAALAA